MPLLVGILVLVLALLVGGALLGIALNLVWYLFVGLVVGGLARLLVPDTGGMSLVATALAGIGGALLGGMIADEVFGWGLLGSLVTSVAVAAVLVAIMAGLAVREGRRGAR